MFRALLWKEWRQLALVRWGGIALGAVLSIAFVAGAELAQRGLLPTGAVTAHARRDLMSEALPAALALALWPLIGLMSAAQAFAGDRAMGTESFLLERPVPRGTVWCARLVAAFGTIVAVIVATSALASTAAALTGFPPGVGWSRWVVLASLGFGVALLAFLGGLIAASLLASPLGAVLLGVLLGALPVLMAAQLAIPFPFARLGHFLLGAVVPVLLLPAYVVASWLALCRGEPAGRGRIRRSLTLLGAAVAGVFVLFVALAPVVVRASAAIGGHVVHPCPSGGSAFVSSANGYGSGGWIVDAASAKKRAFVPPPIRELAWSPDGSEVAILTWAGALGSLRADERIEIRSALDGRVLRSVSVGDGVVYALTWAEAGLVVIVARESPKNTREVEVAIVNSETGAWRPTGFQSEGWSTSLVGPLQDGSVFLRKAVDENVAVGSGAPRGYRLYPIDVAASRVGPAMADASGALLTVAGWGGGLSPSGRFARIVGGPDDPDRSRITDLRAASDSLSDVVPPWARWISGDRLIWHDRLDHRTRLFVGFPGTTPKVLREWRNARVVIEPSPDGRAVLVSVVPATEAPAPDAGHRAPDPALFEGNAPAGTVPEDLVYFPDDDRFRPLSPPFSEGATDKRHTQWAGPKTLARIAPGVVYLEDLGAPGKHRFVIGGPGNLE